MRYCIEPRAHGSAAHRHPRCVRNGALDRPLPPPGRRTPGSMQAHSSATDVIVASQSRRTSTPEPQDIRRDAPISLRRALFVARRHRTCRLEARCFRNRTAMAIQQTEPVRRTYALHLVDADLDHLERAIREPENRMLTAQYWRQRILSIRRQFELTREQRARAEALLESLSQRQSDARPAMAGLR